MHVLDYVEPRWLVAYTITPNANVGEQDRYGWSVAVLGEWVFVGSPNDQTRGVQSVSKSTNFTCTHGSRVTGCSVCLAPAAGHGDDPALV